jgi:hypothetical protein
MRRRLGNIANVLALLLCAAILILWRTEPHWIALGWAGQREYEVHVADGYIELTSTRHMTTDGHPHGNAGEFFAFYHHSSGWGNPLMHQWRQGTGYIRQWSHRDGSISTLFWMGHGHDDAPPAGVAPSAAWLALDTRLWLLLLMLWPVTWVFRRRWRRRTAAKQPPTT